jgi:hypothetical protein
LLPGTWHGVWQAQNDGVAVREGSRTHGDGGGIATRRFPGNLGFVGRIV